MSDSDRIKEVFAEVVGVAPDERAGVIDRLCDGDAGLRARVEALVGAHDAAGGFMAEPTAHPDTPGTGGGAGAEIGQMLGAFTLERVLGEGGFGTVFLGRQDEPIQRQAAIKVLKPGMDSRQVILRFEAERQTLAMMDHEGIAKVIDAGATESGRPFVIMEYVQGRYITDYCEQQRLTVEDRLRLFERICLAVQHAHQKGVIHRDLKPSNILVAEVDGRAAPKIIDFGIAKALAEGRLPGASRLTGGHQLLGTPEYMSPEQAAGAELDTRTDVYSLGVLLYELLCSAPPFDRQVLRRAGPAQLERILREDRPARPSTRIGPGRADLPQVAAARRTDPTRLRRQLRGDLDWIVMRALEKDPERRYPTAYALSADIRRALNDQPVDAGPPSFVYVARKLLKRHRPAAVGIMIAGLLILAALALATTGFYRARAEGLRAEGALADAERQLRVALVAQARAMRRSDTPGRRAASLEAIAQAAEYGASAELRSEAIAALELADLRLVRERPALPLATGLGLDRVDRVATVSEPGVVRIVSLDDGEALAELAAPAGSPPPTLLRFSPDGRYFGARFSQAAGDSLRVWEVASGEAVLAIDDFEASAFAFGGDLAGEPWMAVGRTGGTVEVYSLPGAELLGSFGAKPGWKCVAAARDGRFLAVTAYGELSINLHAIPGGEIVAELDAPSSMLSLELSDDAAVLAAGCADFSIALWATDRPGSPAHVLRGHQGQPVVLEFAPGGVMLASAGWDNTVRLWDLARLEPVIGPIENWGLAGFGKDLVTRRAERIGVWQRRAGDEVRAMVVPGHLGVKAQVAIDPSARFVATGGEEGARLWSIDGSAITRITTDGTLGVEFLTEPAPPRILTLHEDGVRVWRIVESGDGVRVEPSGQLWPEGAVGDARMSLVGEDRLVVAGPEGLVVIDCGNGSPTAGLDPHPGIATAPSVAGRFAFTGNWKGRAGLVRELETGKTVLEVEAEHVVGCFSPDGATLVIGTGAWFACYETPTTSPTTSGSWRQRWRVERDNTDPLAGVLAFSADGSLLALGRSRFALDLVEPETGRLIATLDSPGRRALGEVAISDDGKWIAVATTSDLLQIIDLGRIRDELAELGLDWPRGSAEVSR
jgi:serine/threonine protein kinase/WD40 repeat protein